LAALQRGDVEEHNRFVAAAAQRFGSIDTPILGQFSSARVRSALQQNL
jgi:hypothetical protein